MATAKQVLNVLASQIGYTDNSGRRFWEAMPAGQQWVGAAWCATFQQWGNQKVNAPWIPGNYYCPSIEAEARKAGTWFTNPAYAKAGDLVLYDFGAYSEAVHIGRVERVLLGSGMIQAIEGNTSPTNAGSQNNGRGVWRKVRGFYTIRGFVRTHLAQPDDGVLSMGDQSAAVGNLQRHLNAKHLGHLEVDDIFGTATEAAVKKLQRALNQHGAALDVDGAWGPHTQQADHWHHTFPLPRGHAYAVDDGSKWTHSGVRGHDSDKIEAIQRVVGVKDDGIFGARTERAVALWQRHHHLTADGQVGPATWRKML